MAATPNRNSPKEHPNPDTKTTYFVSKDVLPIAKKDDAFANFGLWFNKYIPFGDCTNNAECKPSDKNGGAEKVKEYYKNVYDKCKTRCKKELEKKHEEQKRFIEAFVQEYGCFTYEAILENRLILGLGLDHPSETSMLFDRNVGIPYIPASSIKGIVRLANFLCTVNDDMEPDQKGFIADDEIPGTKELFGSQQYRGRAIFLDAYPKDVPELVLDIMNPHYPDYYAPDNKTVFPADNQNPNPIKFLTVKEGTLFLFHCLLHRKTTSEFQDAIKNAFLKALQEQGLGAKTSLSYGFFTVIKADFDAAAKERQRKEEEMKEKEAAAEEEKRKKAEQERLANRSEDEKMLDRISSLKKDSQQIGDLCGDLKKKHESGEYRFASTVFQRLKEKLIELGEWEFEANKQLKEKDKKKRKERNDFIDKHTTAT